MSELTIRFKRQLSDFELDINEQLPAQGISVLFGESGCGKTTILRALAGLERLPESFCQLGEHCWQDEQRNHFVPTYRRPIGYVFQEASLFEHLNVAQNLQFGWRRIAPKQRKVSMGDVCQLLGISDKLERRPCSLSGGERQRVAIARALLTSPQLLLMDEPLSALDLARKREFLPYLERLHNELDIPIVYVSHAPEEVIRLADHLVLMKQGRVCLSGPLQQTLLNPKSAQLFADGASSVINTVVTSHLNGLTELACGSKVLQMSKRDIPIGQKIRCRIFASDVSISLTKAQDSSILNLLPATVCSLKPGVRPDEVLVQLELAEKTPLLALLSRYSCQHLKLIPNMVVWVQIKAVAIL
ncbi:molybdenum ABC transporter ATP-binding protein [Celerinatantimonas diazotrophica]|uniref:Molybdate transport system ATP-binding protein n=1 Tax=Celerinatantimonas diazotrophica TaxID=412034 RepID=A0A4R1K4V2_9GAMM|nr:molybdenum ABC transporter ATP-binding protein [Celerinatantimonas diazotrophica]TCK58049.1 molybdate transport system ATP-binding protein [Celerinatantimonas diazotrophica]CAG9297882.1 Vitamin B12 import ATP-binding protein BtuD [Celerinatantimonas diazotrophica]